MDSLADLLSRPTLSWRDVLDIALVSFLAIFFLRFLTSLPSKTRFAFLAASALYLGAAVGLDEDEGRVSPLKDWVGRVEGWIKGTITTKANKGSAKCTHRESAADEQRAIGLESEGANLPDKGVERRMEIDIDGPDVGRSG